jgi:hypothetical protein
MIPLKIECDCGQHYAFEVEPVNGRMPAAVACPGCGADGTAAANELISRQLAPDIATAATNPEPVRLATTRVAPSPESSRRGSIDRDKAEKEARAKIMWGDSAEQVASYLTVQGLGRDEAVEIAQGIFQERAAIVRSNGIKKIVIGLVLVCVPVAAYLVFHARGRFPIRFSIWCYIIGIYGAYMFITGILAVVSPKTEKGAIQKE